MRKHLRIILASLGILAVLLPAAPVLAEDPFKKTCAQPGASNSSLCDSNRDPIVGPNGILVKATRIIALVTAIIAVFIMVIGGFMYVTSGGDPSKINSARATILYAAIGLVVVAMAQAIIIFILNRI